MTNLFSCAVLISYTNNTQITNAFFWLRISVLFYWRVSFISNFAFITGVQWRVAFIRGWHLIKLCCKLLTKSDFSLSIWIFEIFAMFWAGILIFLDFFLTKYIIIFMVFLTDVLGYYYFFTMLYFYIKVNNQVTLFCLLIFFSSLTVMVATMNTTRKLGTMWVLLLSREQTLPLERDSSVPCKM